MPQEPGQGSLHLWLMQANWVGHSLLTRHSGRQLGGEPTKFGRQLQEGELLETVHWALDPQGEGLHGLVTGSSGSSTGKKKFT